MPLSILRAPARVARGLRPVLTLLGALVGTGLASAAAHAAPEPLVTPQAADHRAEWVPYIDPSAFVENRALTCIIDTGVAVTPDTPADDPAGPIVKRTSIHGVPAAPDASGQRVEHGTLMAAAAAAPRNDWGTTGFHPAARLISIRASRVGAGAAFHADDYRKGIAACTNMRDAGTRRIVAASLSLGSSSSTPQERLDLAEAVSGARLAGVVTVAAAGNAPGATGWPASDPAAYAVAAGDRGRGLCDYAAFDAKVALVGPACGIAEPDLATGRMYLTDAGGSSTATAVISASVALLCDLRADLTGPQAMQVLVETADRSSSLPVLDVEAAVRAIGRDAVVDGAKATLRAAQPGPSRSTVETSPSVDGSPPILPPVVPQGSTVPDPTAAGPPLVKPRAAQLKVGPVVASWSRQRLVVRALRRPAETRLKVVALQSSRDFVFRSIGSTTSSGARVKMRLARRPDALRVSVLPAARSSLRPSRPIITSMAAAVARAKQSTRTF